MSGCLSWYQRDFVPAPVRWWHRLLGVTPGVWAWRRRFITTKNVAEAERLSTALHAILGAQSMKLAQFEEPIPEVTPYVPTNNASGRHTTGYP